MKEYIEFHGVQKKAETPLAVLIIFNAEEPAESFTEWVPLSVVEENPNDCISSPGLGWIAIEKWWTEKQGLQSVEES